MKLYKKLIKAFGGAALYVDKNMMKALNIISGDEVVIDVQPGIITIQKPTIDANKIKELLDASEKFKKCVINNYIKDIYIVVLIRIITNCYDLQLNALN